MSLKGSEKSWIRWEEAQVIYRHWRAWWDSDLVSFSCHHSNIHDLA